MNPPAATPDSSGAPAPRLRAHEVFDAAGFRWLDQTSYRQGAKHPQPDMWGTKAGRLHISVGVRPDGWFVWCRTLNIDRAPLDAQTPRGAAEAAVAAILDLLILDVATLQSNQSTR